MDQNQSFMDIHPYYYMLCNYTTPPYFLWPPQQNYFNFNNSFHPFIKPSETIVSDVNIQDLTPKEKLEEKQSKQLEKQDAQQKEIQKKLTNSYLSSQFRNIMPNSLHQILTFVRRKHKSGKITQKIFEKRCPNPKWTVKRYYIYQKPITQRTSHYLKQNSLLMLTQIHDPESNVYSLEEQQFYMQVSRILASYFLNHQSIPLFLTSTRINNKLRPEHLKNRRELSRRINTILNIKKQ